MKIGKEKAQNDLALDYNDDPCNTKKTFSSFFGQFKFPKEQSILIQSDNLPWLLQIHNLLRTN